MNDKKRCGTYINETLFVLKVQIMVYTGYISKGLGWQSLKPFLN